MLSILEREREYRRRMLASAAITIALQLLAWWLLPSPLGPPMHVAVPQREGGGLSLYDVREAGGDRGGAPAPTAAPALPEPAAVPEPAIEPEPPPAPAAEAAPTPATQPSAAPAGSGAAAGAAAGTASGAGGTAEGGGSGSGTGAGSGAGDTGGSGLGIPRVYVQPQVPNRILVQRKIDDYVLLQVLVSADGLVRDVRVLRDIPNCAECTRNAVEAARQNVYNPPVVPPESTGVWSPPFPMRFSYRR